MSAEGVCYPSEHVGRLRVIAAKMPLTTKGTEQHTDLEWLYAAADSFERLIHAYEKLQDESAPRSSGGWRLDFYGADGRITLSVALPESDMLDIEPVFPVTIHRMLARRIVGPAVSIDASRSPHVIAGLLSTIEFTPAERHPVDMLPIARRIIEILEGAP